MLLNPYVYALICVVIAAILIAAGLFLLRKLKLEKPLIKFVLVGGILFFGWLLQDGLTHAVYVVSKNTKTHEQDVGYFICVGNHVDVEMKGKTHSFDLGIGECGVINNTFRVMTVVQHIWTNKPEGDKPKISQHIPLPAYDVAVVPEKHIYYLPGDEVPNVIYSKYNEEDSWQLVYGAE
jgi:hypothetical protein